MDSGPKSTKSQTYQNFQFMPNWVLCLTFNAVFTVLMIMPVKDLSLTKRLALFSKILSLILRLNLKHGSTQFCQVSWILFFWKNYNFIFLGDCYTYGRYYSGSTLFALNTFNALVCQEECLKHNDCKYWIFDKSSTSCKLKATKVLGNSFHSDYISGPKQCWK